MGQDFDRALFQATFSNFLEEIFQKQLQANKIQLDLIRFYQGKSQNVGSHLHIIKNCRKTIETTDCIIKDIKQYFTDLKIPQVYCLFETLFRNLVYTLKTLSQCYLHRFDSNRPIQAKTPYEIKSNTKDIQQSDIGEVDPNCLCSNSQDKNKEDARKIEHLNFFIDSIQAKEAQLQNQMHLLIANVKDEKQKIQKIDSTIRSTFYQEMRKIFSDISNKAQYIFSNHLRAQNDHDNKSSKLMKPEDFQYQIYSQMRRDTKFIAKKKFEEIFYVIVNIFKQKLHKKFQEKQAQLQKTVKQIKRQKQCLMKSQKSKRFVKIKSQKLFKKKESEHDTSLQKEVDEKLAQKIQQNQNLIKQNELLKRQTKLLHYEIQQLKQLMKKQKSQFIKLQFQNQELQKLFKKRTIELQQSKYQINRTINRRVRESAILSSRKSEQSQGISKNLKSFNRKALQLQKETQTQPVSNFGEDLFNCSVAFQHKSFVSMRSKHRRKSTNKQDSINQKNKTVKNEPNIKIILEKVTQLLFKQKTSELNGEEKCNLSNLIQCQKYEQAIEVMKQKLDNLFLSTIKSNESQVKIKQGSKRKSKSKLNKKKYENLSRKTLPQQNINNVKLIHVGVQTQDKTEKKESKYQKNSLNSTAIHSSYQRKQSKKIGTMTPSQQKHIDFRKNGIKTQRISPIGSMISKLNNELDKKGKQNYGSKKLINTFRKSQGQSLSKQYQTHENIIQVSKKKNKFLQNSLFQQINLVNNEMTTAPKRNNVMMVKTPRLKFKQNINQLDRQANVKIAHEQEQTNYKQNENDINFDVLNLKKIDSIDCIMETMKSIGAFKDFDPKLKQQHQKNVAEMFMKFNGPISDDLVHQTIRNYRQTHK